LGRVLHETQQERGGNLLLGLARLDPTYAGPSAVICFPAE
jgi:hypothetical protein